MSNPRTEISQLGEFGLIDKLKSKFTPKNDSTILGIDDDAAIINSQNAYTLLSTDMLLEGIHFDLSYIPLKHLGYKAIAVNVSDVAAMNGIPKQVTVSIGLSNRFSVEAVEELYAGIEEACTNYKVDLIGGDTTASGAGLVISVAIVGEAEEEKKIVRRSTAKESDILCVTGDLGGAYMGLQILEREKAEFQANPEMQPKLDQYDYIVGRQLKPEARMDIIFEINEFGILPSAMIDVSDGLASDLHHICRQSKVGAAVYEDKLPIDNQTYNTAVEFNIDPITCVMNGGEDYELLFTINQTDFEKLKKHADIHFIGYIQSEEKGINLVTKNNNVIPIHAQGWNHFTK